MIKKIFTIGLISLALFTGCSSGSKEPEVAPTLSPSITKPEGQFLDTTPPRMEGLVTAIDNDTITLKIEEQEYTLTLSGRAKEEIDIYKNKHQMPVMVGSFLQIPYDEADGEYTAKNILFVEAN